MTDEINALRQAAQATSGKTLLIDPGTYLMAGLTLNGTTKIYAQGCTAPGFSDKRQRYAASCVVIIAAIQLRRVSAGLR